MNSNYYDQEVQDDSYHDAATSTSGTLAAGLRVGFSGTVLRPPVAPRAQAFAMGASSSSRRQQNNRSRVTLKQVGTVATRDAQTTTDQLVLNKTNRKGNRSPVNKKNIEVIVAAGGMPDLTIIHDVNDKISQAEKDEIHYQAVEKARSVANVEDRMQKYIE